MKKLVLAGIDKSCERCIDKGISLVEELHDELDYFILEVLEDGQKRVKDFDYAPDDTGDEIPTKFIHIRGAVYYPLLKILSKYKIKQASTKLPPDWGKDREIMIPSTGYVLEDCAEIIFRAYSKCKKGFIIFFGTEDVKYVPGILKSKYGFESEHMNLHSEHK
jgi:hypothetical protein